MVCRALHTLLYVRTEQKKRENCTYTGLHQAVPFRSVAFDHARAIHLNPATGIPAASTIQHGRAWLQETLQVCLHSVHIAPTGRPLHRRMIQLPADTPTHLLGTHPFNNHTSSINNTSNLAHAGDCSPALYPLGWPQWMLQRVRQKNI